MLTVLTVFPKLRKTVSFVNLDSALFNRCVRFNNSSWIFSLEPYICEVTDDSNSGILKPSENTVLIHQIMFRHSKYVSVVCWALYFI